jgi:hypothetical protein
VNTPLEDNSAWRIATDSTAHALEVVSARQTVILSWKQFVYAEGGDDEIRIAFASHDVVVRGSGLSPLLRAISGHHVLSIRELARSERFSAPARSVREIQIRKIDAE